MIGLGSQGSTTDSNMDNLFTLLTAVTDPKATKERLAKIADATEELKAQIAENQRLNDDTKLRQEDIQRVQAEVKKQMAKIDEESARREADLAGRESVLAAARTRLSNDMDTFKAAQQALADKETEVKRREQVVERAEIDGANDLQRRGEALEAGYAARRRQLEDDLAAKLASADQTNAEASKTLAEARTKLADATALRADYESRLSKLLNLAKGDT